MVRGNVILGSGIDTNKGVELRQNVGCAGNCKWVYTVAERQVRTRQK